MAKTEMIRTSLRVDSTIYQRLHFLREELDARDSRAPKHSIAHVFRLGLLRILEDYDIPDPSTFTGWLRAGKYHVDSWRKELARLTTLLWDSGKLRSDQTSVEQRDVLFEEAAVVGKKKYAQRAWTAFVKEGARNGS